MYDPAPYTNNLTLYEVNLRQFSPSGSIHEFLDSLPRLKALGAGVLWLMPVHPTGLERRKGSLGSYYSVRDYREIDPLYGSFPDFQHLVEKVHREGMFVILDWVANHTAWDNIWTRVHPEFYVRTPDGSFQPPFPEWEDVIQLDYTKPELRKTMIEMMKFWVTEADIDGFRCDMAKLVPVDFWREAIHELRRLKPLMMLAEAEDRSLLDAGFDALYGWNLLHYFDSLIHGSNNASRLDALLQPEFFSFPAQKAQLLFTSNHDENSWNGPAVERLGAALEAASVLSFTLPGMPMIYSGQESGMNHRLNFFDKDLIPWKQDKMETLYTQLSHLRKNKPALWSGKEGGIFRRIANTRNQDVFTFTRETGTEEVLVMINLSWEAASFTIKGYVLENQYRDGLTGKTIFPASGADWRLEPWCYKILVK